MRPIDADREIRELEKMVVEGETFTTAVEFAKSILLNAPTVDAVPVIRCKDCKYYDSHHEVCCVRIFYRLGHDADDYCSDAERKDE